MNRAAVLTKINAFLEIAEVETTALQYGQLKVKLLASGICGSQLQEIRGEKGGPLPHLLGHEGCGIVEEIGPAVTQVAVGDKVVLHWRKGDGIESDFPRYIYDGKTITSGKVVTFSEHAVVSENRVTRVPADAPRELCALLGCSLSTALGTIENEAELKFGERILIVGVGGLGSSLILAAKLRGAGYISACDVYDKAALAHVMGAHEFCYSADVHKSFDVIVDTAGAGDSMASTLPFLRSGGRFIMLGQQRPKDDVVLRNARHLFDGEGKRIIATQGGRFNPSADVPRYIHLWQSGALNLDQLITHRIDLSEINLGLDLVRKGHAGRVLVDF